MIIGGLLNLSGDVKGMLLFLLEQEFAHLAVHALLGVELKRLYEVE